MAGERLKSPRLRLFVALDLPGDVRAALAAWQARELNDPALRPLPPEALHMTLAFLGYQREGDVERIAEVALAQAEEPFGMRLLPEVVPIPRRGAPRLYAAGAESPAAVAIQERVARVLAQEAFYKPEKRPFWPHLTVARVRGAKQGAKARMRVDRAPRQLPESLQAPFFSVRMTLYRSILRREGAEYVPLAHVDLPSASAGGGRKGDEDGSS